MTMIERVAAAIEEAQLRHREGPYGFYDYSDYVTPTGLNIPFHIRDFRDPKSGTYGKTIVSSNDYASLQRTYEKMTREYVARKAIEAMRESGEHESRAGFLAMTDFDANENLHDKVNRVFRAMIDAALSEPSDGN